MRSILAVCLGIALLETVFYSVLSPLLPVYEREYGFSETTIGMIVGAHSLGSVLGALPAARILRRLGVRATVGTAMSLLGVAALTFGLAHDPALLMGARVVSGFCGSIAWTTAMVWVDRAAPPADRGRMVGLVLGGAYVGSSAGPLVGAVAVAIGSAAAFTAIAVACLGFAVVAVARAAGDTDRRADAGVARNGSGRFSRISIAVLLLFLASSSLTGARTTVEPLQLADQGLSELMIAVTLGLGAVGMAIIAVRGGRIADPRVVRRILLTGIAGSLAVSGLAAATLPVVIMLLVAVALGPVLQLIWTPSLALLGEQTRLGGASSEATWAAVAFTFAGGAFGGSVASSMLAEHSSYAVAWAPLVGLTAVTALGLVLAGAFRQRSIDVAVARDA